MMTDHTLTIDQHKLVAHSTASSSNGSPIILLHGITASINFWGSDQLALFSQFGPTYSLSLPGHYPAKFPDKFPESNITPQMMADVLAQAICQLSEGQKVTVIGHSTGGFAALCLAIYHPEIIERLIIISGFAKGKWIGAFGLNQKMARGHMIRPALFKSSYQVLKWSRFAFRQAWRVHMENHQSLSTYPHLDSIFNKFYPDYKQLDLEAMLKYFKVMPDIDITSDLFRINVPTLVLTGDQDPTVPSEQSHLIAKKISQAELVVIEGGGHFLFMEYPEIYKQTLQNWLMTKENVPHSKA